MGDPRLQHIAENFDSMKRDMNDTFRFHCTQCGKCCINREDILMSPQDVFKAAQALQMTPHDFVPIILRVLFGKHFPNADRSPSAKGVYQTMPAIEG